MRKYKKSWRYWKWSDTVVAAFKQDLFKYNKKFLYTILIAWIICQRCINQGNLSWDYIGTRYLNKNLDISCKRRLKEKHLFPRDFVPWFVIINRENIILLLWWTGVQERDHWRALMKSAFNLLFIYGTGWLVPACFLCENLLCFLFYIYFLPFPSWTCCAILAMSYGGKGPDLRQ